MLDQQRTAGVDENGEKPAENLSDVVVQGRA
jgi:hypothetical protein